eukprot:gene28794-34761_t
MPMINADFTASEHLSTLLNNYPNVAMYINLFFTHLEFANELPFDEPIDENLLEKSYVRTLEVFHSKFAIMVSYIASLLSKLQGGTEDLAFKHLIEGNKLLFLLVNRLQLREIGVFAVGDIGRETKLANLVLYILAGVNFSSDAILPWISGVWFDANTLLGKEDHSDLLQRQYRQEKWKSKKVSLSFYERVLSPHYTQPINLKKIAPSFDMEDYCSVTNYYEQFVEPIYEEIRSTIDQALTAIQNKRERKMPVTVTINHCNYEESNQVQEFSCAISGMDKAYLERSPTTEVAQLSFDEESFLGILTDFVLDDSEHHRGFISCKLLVLRSVYAEKLAALDLKYRLQAYFLMGIEPSRRMLNALRRRPGDEDCPVLRSIITGVLPQCEERPESLSVDAVSHALAVAGNLNEQQAKVVIDFSTLSRGLFLLQGPPGTGKTTTIVHLLKHMLELEPNQRIMVTAPSNAAVHTLAERAMAEMGLGVSMAFWGVEKELSEDMRSIRVNGIAKHLISDIRRLRKFALNYKYLNPSFVEKVTHDVIRMIHEHRAIYKKIDARFLLQCQLRFDYSGHLKKAIIELLNDIDAQLPVIEKCVEDLVASGVSSSKEILTTLINSLALELENYGEIIARSCTQYDSHLESFMLTQSQLIFCTLVSSGSNTLRKSLHFVDTLIIDEAGQAVEPELLIPNYFNAEKCLQVGDSKQLPPTIKSDANKAIEYDSIMHRLVDRVGVVPRMLEVQYRMNSAICTWPSNKYYSGLLRPDDSLFHRSSVLKGVAVCDHLYSPCLFVDVANGSELGKRHQDSSYRNPEEADCAIAIVSYLLSKGVQPQSIGVIAFYSSQVGQLRQNFASRRVDEEVRKLIKISTVDGFQGMECDIIILCTTRTCRSAGFLRDFRRINVAVTRAKHHLYVLGKKAILEQSNTDFTHMICHYEENEGCAIVDSTQLLSSL